jgi:hypothetical protein
LNALYAEAIPIQEHFKLTLSHFIVLAVSSQGHTKGYEFVVVGSVYCIEDVPHWLVHTLLMF